MSFKVVNGLRTIEFGTEGTSREELTNLVIHGNKRATATTAQEYVDENEPVEHVGEELYLLGNGEEVVGKIRVTKVELCSFIDVPDGFALAEAGGDLNGDDFRESHRRYFNRIGVPIEDSTPMVLVYFDLL